MFPGLALIIVSVMVIIIVRFVINDEKKTIDTTVKILNACFSSFFHMKIVRNQ